MSQEVDSIERVADLRALRARTMIRIYELGAKVQVHPGALSSQLKGRLPMTKEVADRIERALHEEEPRDGRA